jgi:hypothetical protein
MLHSPFVCLQRHERVRAAELDDAIVGIRNPEADWLDSEHELDCQRLGLTDIILCEVLQGVQDDSTAADVERRLRRLEVFELVVSNWPLKLRGTTVFCELVVMSVSVDRPDIAGHCGVGRVRDVKLSAITRKTIENFQAKRQSKARATARSTWTSALCGRCSDGSSSGAG